MPVAGSKRLRRLRPLSITSRTPAMVRELSAMAVASTILPAAWRAGAIACSWASRFSWPCRSASSGSWPQAVASMARWVACNSRCPGRKISTVSAALRWSSQWASRARTTCRSSRSSGRLTWCCIVTGQLRPWLSITSAPSSRAASGARSSVADISSRRRSGRSSWRA